MDLRRARYSRDAYFGVVFDEKDADWLSNEYLEEYQKELLGSKSESEQEELIQLIDYAPINQRVLYILLTFNDKDEAIKKIHKISKKTTKQNVHKFVTCFYYLFNISPAKKVRGKANILGRFFVQALEERKENAKTSVQSKRLPKNLKSSKFLKHSDPNLVDNLVKAFKVINSLPDSEYENCKNFLKYAHYIDIFKYIDLNQINKDLENHQGLYEETYEAIERTKDINVTD